MSTKKDTIKPQQEAAKKPGKDDIHEQREQGQSQEGATKQTPPPSIH